MITKKQVHIALITGLTAFSLSYHQAWASCPLNKSTKIGAQACGDSVAWDFDPGEQATEEGEILIFSEGTPEVPGAGFYIKEQNSNPGSQFLASDIHQDLTAFVEQNTGGIEEALLASESVQQGEALLAYNAKSGEWEEVLLSTLTEASDAISAAEVSHNKAIFMAFPVSLFASTLSVINAPQKIASGMVVLLAYGAAVAIVSGAFTYTAVRIMDLYSN